MVQVTTLSNALLRKRPNGARWPYVLPGLIALLFVGHAYEDAGLTSALLYGGVIAISVLTAIRPNVLGWSVLTVLFFAYGVAVLFSRSITPTDERIMFTSLGFVPTLLLYLGRPHKQEGFFGAKSEEYQKDA